MKYMPVFLLKFLKKLFSRNIILILLVLLLICGWFYWFEWRPTTIRKICYKETFDLVKGWRESNENGNNEWQLQKEWVENPQQEKWHAEWGWWYPVPNDLRTIEVWYAKCLLEKGLKAEIPITPKLK